MEKLETKKCDTEEKKHRPDDATHHRKVAIEALEHIKADLDALINDKPMPIHDTPEKITTSETTEASFWANNLSKPAEKYASRRDRVVGEIDD